MTEREKKVILFGGTTEGRLLAKHLEQLRIPTDIAVATEYGKEVLRGEVSDCRVFVGRMDDRQMEDFIRENGGSLVIDATHPYATEVTENITRACERLSVPVKRVIRESVPFPAQTVCVDSTREAVDYLAGQKGIVLITTGSKELHYFCGFPSARERLTARILPVEQSVSLARQNGFADAQLICEAGPFSTAQNLEAIRRVHADFLLTKDTGREGGFPEKMEAAERAGIVPVVIRRPTVEQGLLLEDMIIYLPAVSF